MWNPARGKSFSRMPYQRRVIGFLKPCFPAIGEDIYPEALRGTVFPATVPNAVLEVAEETGMEEAKFPETFVDTGWTPEQVLDFEFFTGPREPQP